jgi:hypothetical protein
MGEPVFSDPELQAQHEQNLEWLRLMREDPSWVLSRLMRLAQAEAAVREADKVRAMCTRHSTVGPMAWVDYDGVRREAYARHAMEDEIANLRERAEQAERIAAQWREDALNAEAENQKLRERAERVEAALREILGPSPTRHTTIDRAPKWVRDIARDALARREARDG